MSVPCLVTGGAGFIGSHLVEALTASGHPVRVLDDFSSGRLENLASIDPAPEIISGSLTDARLVAEAMRGIRWVFHLGALASVARSVESPLLCHEVCVNGTLNVLEAARQEGSERVVYAASASCYGRSSQPEGQDEESPLTALSPYAAAKLAGEFYLQAYANTFHLPTVRLRLFNVYGPRQPADSPYSGVIAIFCRKLLAGETPTIHGDGLQTRDFVYVQDVVSAMILAAQAPHVAGRVYNIGTGQSLTLLELVRHINQILGSAMVPQHGPARLGDVRHSRARIDRARRELGYQPRVPLQEGLRHTLDWYRKGE